MSRRSSISDTVGSAIAGDVATEVGRIARSRRRSHVESTKAASLFTGSCYRDLPAMMLERRVISCKRHDELVLLGTDELSVKISSSEILELAVALGVTPSASAFWQRHKSIEDALSLIIEDKMAREGARYAALVESEESYLATIRARATTASDVLPDSGAPSALSSAAGACDRPSSSGVTRSRRSSASLRSSASQVDVAATADGPLAAPDRAIESSQPLRAGAGALHETDPLESKSTRAGLNSAHSSGGALESTADIRVATLTKVSDTTLAAIVSPHLPQVIPISQLEEFVKGHTSDAPEESAVSGEIPSRLAALESLLKIDALLSVSKSSNGQRMTLMVERENRPEDSLPPIAAEAADMASAVAALRASEPRLQVQLNKAPVPRAAPSGAAARVTASSTCVHCAALAIQVRASPPM